MKVYFLLLVSLLVASSSVRADDGWSWGKEKTEEVPVAPAVPEEERSGRVLDVQPPALVDLPHQEAPLPIEAHPDLAKVEEGRGGRILEGEATREGRFLGITDKLCDLGIGFNCKNAQSHSEIPPRVGKPGYGSSYSSYGGRPKPVHPGLPSKGYPIPNKGYPVLVKGYPAAGMRPPAPPQPVGSSFVSTNPVYAPLLPSYPTPKPAYKPQPTYAPAKPTYGAPKPAYVAPKPTYAPSRPAYVQPKPVYTQPAYVEPKPTYAPLKPTYAPPKSVYVASQTTYGEPKPNYAAPKLSHSHPTRVAVEDVHYVEDVHVAPNHVQSVYTSVVGAGVTPTAVKHLHSHTHIYQLPAAGAGSYTEDSVGSYSGDSVGSILVSRDGGSVQVSSAGGAHTASLGGDVVRVAPTEEKTVVVPAVQKFQPEFRPGKIEHGFQPSTKVETFVDLDTLFRPRQAVYQEDCHCVPDQFCPRENRVPRTSDVGIRNLVDARSRKTNILSNATDVEVEEDSVDTSNVTTSVVLEEEKASSRRRKMLDLSKVMENIFGLTEEVVYPENATEIQEANELQIDDEDQINEEPAEEDVTTVLPPEEQEDEIVQGSRRRRDTEGVATAEGAGEEEDIDVPAADVPYSDRQGRQLNGYTPGPSGCRPGTVCCRRPVYTQKRSRSTCGRRNNGGIHGRIKSPHFEKGDTQFGEYPWHVALLRRQSGDVMYVCGGTLIDSEHVVTAAHCVKELLAPELKVRLGEWDVNRETEFYKHVEVPVSGIFIHPEFYDGNLVNDLAVIRLHNPVDLESNPHIAAVCLPAQHEDFTGQRCYASGWGKDAFGDNGKFQHILKEVEMPIVSHSQCQEALRTTRLGREFHLDKGNMCAGGEEGKDACKGDGGSPLVCNRDDGTAYVAGLVSWGIGCGEQGIPGVYVNIPHYIDWIRAVTAT